MVHHERSTRGKTAMSQINRWATVAVVAWLVGVTASLAHAQRWRRRDPRGRGPQARRRREDAGYPGPAPDESGRPAGRRLKPQSPQGLRAAAPKADDSAKVTVGDSAILARQGPGHRTVGINRVEVTTTAGQVILIELAPGVARSIHWVPPTNRVLGGA